MAQFEDMRLPARAREALVDDPSFLREMVEATLNRLLDTEITEHVQAGPYERSEARTGYRNGYRSRQLKTRVGTLTLAVPTDREGSFRTELFERYQRSAKALVAGLMELAAFGRPGGREHQKGQGHHRGVVRHGLQQEHREPLGGGVGS